MDNRTALNPQLSVVVEACAGSGKTWLLVSRIVRLLLDGVAPGEILAITFTRKAAQEMQARLHEWLRFLAVEDDAPVRTFLRERELHEADDALLERARSLYHEFMLAQPAITISTFHGWFMQIIQRAPLNAGVPVGMGLAERISALRDEAWQELADSLRAAPDGETAQHMQWLFAEYGLASTRTLLENFVAKRSEWWAYTDHLPSPAGGITSDLAALPPSRMASSSIRGAGGEGSLVYALEHLRTQLGVEPDADPITDACADPSLAAAVHAFAQVMGTGTEAQCEKANEIQIAWETADAHQRFAALVRVLYTQKDEPRSFKATKKQNAEAFQLAYDALFARLQAARDALAEHDALRMNQAALHCGAALLAQYQELKRRQQQIDFTDLEWQVCRLLNQSDHAEYMQYKLDSRYRHVLLDEFQDTNPLQWQILQAWFAASAAVGSQPTVFVVGDPKQSIYRFRRADARLFGVARRFLESDFGAKHLTQNETRRNAPAVLEAVNGVFAAHPNGFVDFEPHVAHHRDLPGHVVVLPLAVQPPLPQAGEGWGEGLRNPLTTPRAEEPGGARELEAEQFAAHIADIVAHWNVQDGRGGVRRAEYRDIMVLVRKRTHLRVYEHALRALRIPFLTSRRGGLLDTLEAEDIQALLTFLITPFADLELAQALRSPLFACSDKELMQIASVGEDRGARSEERGQLSAPTPQSSILNPRSSWWSRLQQLPDPSPALKRARDLLKNWLQLADKLPVHDLLDRIYFEGDLVRRYMAALPAELHEAVRANLQAFMEIALNVDAGRYPSLPRFLAELRELRAADDEAPDEGKVGEAGNALRIYTVHEAKGLEAPIVWLLDANDTHQRADGYGVLLDWPPDDARPAHFSLFADKRSRGARRAHLFEADEEYARREDMNLLYVAMTRARQALLVSGNGERAETSWYGRIAAAVEPRDNPLAGAAGRTVAQFAEPGMHEGGEGLSSEIAALQRPLPTGQRAARATPEQRRGVWLHALLQHLASSRPLAGKGPGERAALQQRIGIPEAEMESLWQQAQQLLALPHLQRFFDPQHYRSAFNEMSYVNARGELKRIDRLVEFDDEVWVLDYKTGEKADVTPYRAQMAEYRSAMQAVYVNRAVRCALLFAGGALHEVELPASGG